MRKIIVFVVASLLIFNPPLLGRQLSKTDFIKDVNILFLKEDYAGLIRNGEANLSRYRLDRKEKKEILYLMGLSYIKLNDFSKAREIFNDILEMKGDEFRQDAYIGIANSYFDEGKFNKAIASYEDVLNIYPRSDRLSSVYYNLGLCYKAKKDFNKANFYFKKIKKEYTKSFESDRTVYLPTQRKVSYYIIQLGAFRSLRNAKKLGKKLARKKYDYYIQKIKKDREVLYRVRGGKFSNKYYAKRLLRKLRRDGFYAKIVVE